MGGGPGGPDLFGPGNDIPLLPTLEDFFDGGSSDPTPAAQAPLNLNTPSLFQQNTASNPPRLNLDSFFENVPSQQPSSFNNSTRNIGDDLFGSQVATTVRDSKTKTQAAVDDFLYELPEDMPDLELGDGLLQTLGAEAEELFDSSAPLTKREEEDEILKDLMAEYDVENIKTTMDETGQIPESIYFLYGGESQNFVNALNFIGLSPINRELVSSWSLTLVCK